MAESLSHTWGQIIGDVFESTFTEFLSTAAKDVGVYIDYNGNKRAVDCGVRHKGKLAWKDEHDNWHQLDFVFERGGTIAKVGIPLAFVEVAWRRYTKHSKNKAQEIEGALLPIAQTHRHAQPFLGAIIGGEFTAPSITQLKSRGFAVIHVPYPNIVAAFATVGVDARSTEETTEAQYRAKIEAFSKLAAPSRRALHRAITASVSDQIATFTKNLHASISRQLVSIRILPLHGESHELVGVQDAVAFIAAYDDEEGTESNLVRYEIEVRFSNGTVIHGEFQTKSEATAFLRLFDTA